MSNLLHLMPYTINFILQIQGIEQVKDQKS